MSHANPPSSPTPAPSEEAEIDRIFKEIVPTGHELSEFPTIEREFTKAKTALAALLVKARIDQTEFLREAERKFGKVDWEAALRELKPREKFKATLRSQLGGE